MLNTKVTDTNESRDTRKQSDVEDRETRYEKQINDVDFDQLLVAAGEFGKYQILLLFATFPFYIFGVFVYYSQLFITEVSSNHWCWIPELANLTDVARRSLAIPPAANTRFGYSHCETYFANWTEVLISGALPNSSLSTVFCQHGWEYNKSEIPYPTISSDLNWVCDKNSYQASAQTIFFIGSILGGFIFGWVSDKFGRLPALIASNIIGCVGGVASTFTNSFIAFATCRLIMGMAYDNSMMMAYIIVLEYVAPKYRSIMTNMSFAIFYAGSATMLPWLMLLCNHWKTISLATSLPLLLAVFSPLFLPESPRWLLSKGKVEDTILKILTIARSNNKEVPVKLLDNFRHSISNKPVESDSNCMELLKRPLLRNMFISICIAYMSCTIVFDGLVRSIGQLDFDFFLSFSMLSFTEFPSMFLTAFVIDWTGRKWLITISLIITCIFSVLTVFVNSSFSLICIVIARFFVNIAYGAAMQWAPEMLPITVRGAGSSFIHVCGSIATTLSPYVIYTENYVIWLPLVVFGAIAGFGAIVAFTLPETANKDMPNTYKDAEDLIRYQKMWDLPFLNKKSTENVHVKKDFEM